MPYIIKQSAAKMPNKVIHPYVWIAVLEVEPGVTEVAMISDRARGVRRVVQTWGPVPRDGKTSRSGVVQAMDEARALVAAQEAQDAATAA